MPDSFHDLCLGSGTNEVSARIELELGDFPVDDPDVYALHAIACAIESVSEPDAQGLVTTGLGCASEPGTAHAVTLKVEIGADEQPGWSAGEEALLSVDWIGVVDSIGVNDLSLALTTEDGQLLVAAVGNGAPVDDAIAPLAISIDDEACPSEDSESSVPARVEYSLDDGTLELYGSDAGRLAAADTIYAVRQQDAAAGDFGESSLLLQLTVFAIAE
jgi:hypothetical protein